ncbi:hypothetical protein MUB24_06695 [Lederbergia sp. NSJ-179]|uniref:hypothetical protein n=1 Tax=Lederbergia sp. NSJ-179 TaxID=2931402 RepID=UPI001FCF90FD|nr:hypothetical protein [Lederbergia sp. NSJ-179]MCJ7840601.1 hypothetical protein [Lederbergia sp. NSJ-179]
MPDHSVEEKQILAFLNKLKEKDAQFQKERAELRADFLIRGICEKEVDGLLEDPSLFPKTWLPLHLRWDSLREAGDHLPALLTEAKELLCEENSSHIDFSKANLTNILWA